MEPQIQSCQPVQILSLAYTSEEQPKYKHMGKSALAGMTVSDLPYSSELRDASILKRDGYKDSVVIILLIALYVEAQ